MKQLSFTLFLSFLYCALHAQPGNPIVIGHIDSIHSKILGEQRKIWVYVPNSDDSAVYAKQRYPVVYLLDGDAHFFSVAGMIRQLSSVNGNTICPQMIVVGIPNTDRTRDLTPTHLDAAPPFMDSAASKTSGGGEKFISFIEKELILHIDSLYPTEPYRMLIGHSFGGLTVTNTLIHRPRLFNAYVAIDPSMWWDHQKLLHEAKLALAGRDYRGESLYLGIANTMSPGMANNFGYQALGQKQFDAAESLFRLNIANYPQSPNAYDSMGDYYAARGDKEKAIENYPKALSLKEMPETRGKLEKLKKEKRQEP